MESENKSGGGGYGGGGGGSGGRLLVEETCWDLQSDRVRFQIDLKEGETTIVSWSKMLRDAGIPVDQSSAPPSPEPPPQKWFHQEDESRSECSNIILKKEKHEQNDNCFNLEGINVVQATKNTRLGHARVKFTTNQKHDNRK